MLTVLLATRNRATILRQTLEAFCLLEAPPHDWKLVVVDNGSTDQTSSVLASFANRLPLQTIREPAGGKNSALNAGLDFVEGDLVAFTDDDVFPRIDWLVELRKAVDRQPAYFVFGGAILPRWEIPPPPWVGWVEDQVGVYAITDPSMKEGIVPPYLILGPNMAIRAVLFESGVRFDTSFGPRSSSYPMGSETELTVRLDQQGYKAWHVPDAVVEHLIRRDQICKSWVLKRAIRLGRGVFRLWHMRPSGDDHRWFGVPRHYFREIVEQEMSAMGAWLRSNERQLFSACWKRNYLWGHVVEAHLSHRVQGSQLNKLTLPSSSDQKGSG
jgi:glycosyltransferase involved in cell wall biosynthesis